MEWLSAQPWLPYLDDNGDFPASQCATVWARHSTTMQSKSAAHLQDRHTKLKRPQKPPRNFSARAKFSVGFKAAWSLVRARLAAAPFIADRVIRMNTKVNNAVKFREWWRPFAPSLKKEVAPDYLESAYDFAVHDSHRASATGNAASFLP